MVAIQDYQGREQSYVKHVFLERYLERLVHKTASSYDHIVYVDGFAGPWQSASERFQDTSFGIALNALRQAKATWKAASRDVKMSAYLVEQDRVAYATRHPKGIEVFRDCQLKTLQEQAKTRAATKVKHAETTTGQREIFESLHDMAPNDLGTKLAAAKAAAEKTLLELTPAAPAAVKYELATRAAKHLVRLPDVNQIAARLRKEQRIIFPDWESGKRVPQSNYTMHKP